VLLHVLRGLELVAGTVGVEPHALQREAQQLANIGFVIDNQNSAFLHHAPWHRMVNCAPAGVSM
jgi:hypothetical protein